MFFVGITGGIGSGKSALISYMEKNYKVKALIADDIAKNLMKKNEKLYYKMLDKFGNIILDKDGNIDKKILSDMIFSDTNIRKEVNNIVHPMVKEYIKDKYIQYKKQGNIDILIVEAALLIEDNYDKILDEIWYISAKEEVRAKRLKENRHYTDKKILDIFSSQLTDYDFKKSSDVIIHNNEDIVDAYRKIDREIHRVLSRRM